VNDSFSSDSIIHIHSLGKDWANLREHAPPYKKKGRMGHRDHHERHGPGTDRDGPEAPKIRNHPEAEDSAEGFEITI